MIEIDDEFYNNFDVIKRLGDGANSEVYLVKENRSGNVFAAKIIKTENFNFQEIKIWKLIKDEECIIKYFSTVQTKNNISILMEVVKGKDLFSLIREKKTPMKEDKVVDLFRQLIAAVKTMHLRGICHLDIKHENIMIVKKSQRLKLIDYDSCQEGEMVVSDKGTMHFLPPERISDKNIVFNGFKADVWACGVVLFEMYTRQYPFSDDSDEHHFRDMMQRIKTADYIKKYYDFMKSRKRFALFQDLISKILIVDPDKRCSLDDILVHPFLFPTTTICP